MLFLRQVNIATEKWFLYDGNDDDDANIAIVFHDNSHTNEFIAKEKPPKIDVAKRVMSNVSNNKFYVTMEHEGNVLVQD